MDTQEILNKIAKLKNAIQSESDADVKATYQKKVDALEKQIAEAEQKVEKIEAKASADEKKDLSEAEQKIKKLESALSSESDPDVKERYQKKIKQLKETLQGVKEEIKEEKKDIAEQKKDIKEAVKEIKSVDKSVRKVAIKKVATKISERKETVKKKSKRKDKLKSIVSELDALINKNKKLKSKYTAEYKGTGKTTDKKRDAGRSAKPFGYRFVGKHDYRVPTEAQVRKGLKRGTIDYEARPNRSDVYPKRTVKLADGGMMADGGKVLVGKFDEKQLRNGEDKKAIDKKMKETGLKYIDSKIIKKNGKPHMMEVYLYADGGMMAHGGKTQGYDDREDERLAMKYGRMGSKDLDSTRSRRDDARFEERGKMADGGMMAEGGEVKEIVDGKDVWYLRYIDSTHFYLSNSKDFKGSAYHIGEFRGRPFYEEVRSWLLSYNKMAQPEWAVTIISENGDSYDWDGFAKNEDDAVYKAEKEAGFESVESGVNMITDEYGKKIEYKKGGTVKKKTTSKSKPKPSKKVGKSIQDKHRFAKPAGWRWKEEAVTKKIIERKQLSMSPMKKMRDKYPDYVYYEDRLNKADQHPTRSSKDSI